MSSVTDLVMVVSICEDDQPVLPDMHDWMKKNYDSYIAGHGFKDLSGQEGGNKAMGDHLYAGSFNYFPVKEFLQFYWDYPFKDPLGNCLLIQGEHDAGFSLIRPRGIPESTVCPDHDDMKKVKEMISDV